MKYRCEKAQRVIDDLDMRALAAKTLSECNRLALRHAKRVGRSEVDQTLIDDIFLRFVTELDLQLRQSKSADAGRSPG